VFSREQIKGVNNSRQFFGLCGEVNYKIDGIDRVLPLCTYYDPEEKTYMDCTKPSQNPN
jgi:hypothetical protein